jgi:hypothetical protein
MTLDRKAFYAVATLLVDPKSIPLDGEKLTSKNFEMYIPESSRAVLERLKEYVLRPYYFISLIFIFVSRLLFFKKLDHFF